MKVKPLVVVLFYAAAMSAATITTSSTCTTSGGISVVTGSPSSQCSQAGGPTDLGNSSTASATGSASVKGNSFTIYEEADGQSSSPSLFGGAAASDYVDAKVSIIETLYLPGSGTGLITLPNNTIGESNSGGGECNYCGITLDISGPAGKLYSGGLEGGPFTVPRELKVKLGTDVTFTITSEVYGTGSIFDGTGGGIAGVQTTFEFFAGNGVTPVDAVETPEPAAWTMLGVGLLGIAAKRMKRGC